MPASTKPLTEALAARAERLHDVVSYLRDADKLDGPEAQLLRETVELVRCLRRLVGDATTTEIHRAFGSPGDFGYETPIGAALAKVYGAT